MQDSSDVLARVRRSLGRTETPTQVPPAPVLPDPTVRLVHTEIGLSELFASRAAELKMIVTPVTPDEVIDALLTFLRKHPIRRIALAVSPLLTRLGVRDALAAGGFEVKNWDEMTLDELYDYDCAITDVDFAVAETGSLVIRPDAEQGRGLSLVPMYHVALVEPKNLVADLVDLFERLNDPAYRSNVVLISGPSKTADIEMNVVTGVHGPNVVNAFILR